MKKFWFMMLVIIVLCALAAVAMVKLATGDSGDVEYKLYIPNVRMECSPGYDCTPQSEPTQIPED